MLHRPLCLLLTLAALAGSARADFLLLRDGRVVEGVPIARAEGGVKLSYANGEVFVRQELISDVLIEQEVLAPASTPEEEAQRGKGMVRFEGRWITPKAREDQLKKRIAKKLAEIEEIKAHSEWRSRRQEKSKNFAFEHTLQLDVFEDYRDLMEAYFAQFLRDWKISAPKDLGRLKVCLYSDYDDMIQVGGAGNGVLGYFRFMPPLELNFFHDRLDPAFTEEVMFHETNHYLQKLIDMDFSMPHFPGESLAEYYGASSWDPVKKKLSTGLILEGRLVEVQDDISSGDMMELKRLISSERMYEHYTWGWTLVHFVMNDKRYTAKFQKWIMALPSAKDIKRQVNYQNLKDIEAAEVARSFMDYLGIKDDAALATMQKEWHAYVQEKLSLVTPRGKEAAARSAKNYGRHIKAKRLYKEAIEGGSTNPTTYHGYADLLAREGKSAEAQSMWKKAIELDPLTGEYYWGMGRSIKVKGDKAEGERWMKLAKEVDPEGSYIDIDLEALLSKGEDGEDGKDGEDGQAGGDGGDGKDG